MQDRLWPEWRATALAQMPKAVGSESQRPSEGPLGLFREPPAAGMKHAWRPQPRSSRVKLWVP